MTDDLITWLRAQLDEDERVARACEPWAPSPWVGAFKQVTSEPAGKPEHVAGTVAREVSHHMERWQPARVLAELDAKQRLLDLHEIVDPGEEWQHCRVCHDNSAHDAMRAPCSTLRLLALPYNDREGYRSEWAP